MLAEFAAQLRETGWDEDSIQDVGKGVIVGLEARKQSHIATREVDGV